MKKGNNTTLCDIGIPAGALIVIALSACGSDNGEPVASEPMKSELKVVAIRPVSLQDQDFRVGENAVVVIESTCLENGISKELDSDGRDNFVATFKVDTTGSCSFSISFSVTDFEYGDVKLVSGDIQRMLTSGRNAIAFSQRDYIESDSDGDGVVNLVELSEKVRSNPFQKPLWGEMTWGREVWTER